jgi:hypothetical protein
METLHQDDLSKKLITLMSCSGCFELLIPFFFNEPGGASVPTVRFIKLTKRENNLTTKTRKKEKTEIAKGTKGTEKRIQDTKNDQLLK